MTNIIIFYRLEFPTECFLMIKYLSLITVVMCFNSNTGHCIFQCNFTFGKVQNSYCFETGDISHNVLWSSASYYDMIGMQFLNLTLKTISEVNVISDWLHSKYYHSHTSTSFLFFYCLNEFLEFLDFKITIKRSKIAHNHNFNYCSFFVHFATINDNFIFTSANLFLCHLAQIWSDIIRTVWPHRVLVSGNKRRNVALIASFADGIVAAGEVMAMQTETPYVALLSCMMRRN